MAVDADLVSRVTPFGDRRDVAVGVETWWMAQRLGVRGGVRRSTIGESRAAATAGVSAALKAGNADRSARRVRAEGRARVERGPPRRVLKTLRETEAEGKRLEGKDDAMPVRIGELLLKEKRISAEQLQEALNYQRTNGGKLGANLVKLGYVKDEEITALLSKQYGVPSIALNQFEIDPAVIKLVPAETARKYQIVPLSRAGATLTIAMTDPTNVFAMDDVKFMTGYNVEPVVASETAVLDSIDKYYGVAGAAPRRRSRGGNQAARRSSSRPAKAPSTRRPAR